MAGGHGCRRAIVEVERAGGVERGGGDQALIACGGIERACGGHDPGSNGGRGRGGEDEGAFVSAAGDVGDAQDGRAGVAAGHVEGAEAEAECHRADFFIAVEVAGPEEAERAGVKREAGGVAPAALTTRIREETGRVIQTDRATHAQRVSIRIGRSTRIVG